TGNGPHASGAHSPGRNGNAAMRREPVRPADARRAIARRQRRESHRAARDLSGANAPSVREMGGMEIAVAGGHGGTGAAVAQSRKGLNHYRNSPTASAAAPRANPSTSAPTKIPPVSQGRRGVSES